MLWNATNDAGPGWREDSMYLFFSAVDLPDGGVNYFTPLPSIEPGPVLDDETSIEPLGTVDGPPSLAMGAPFAPKLRRGALRFGNHALEKQGLELDFEQFLSMMIRGLIDGG